MTITRDPIRDIHRLMGLENSLQGIGEELVEHSRQEVIAERSAIEELFPYIIIASKKMSARAISRWFTDQKNIPISAASVAKAIREQDRYCELIYKRARVGADYLANLSAFTPDEILADQRDEWKTILSEYETKLNGTAEEKARSKELIIGIKMLNEWTGLPDDIRELCIEKCITNKTKGESKE